MDPERWTKIERVFQLVLDAGQDRRAAILEQSCAGDESLRREVESLLRHHDQARSFIENPAFAAAATAQSSPARRKLAGATIAHYRVLEEIGGGGMGVVYKAEDTKLGRVVALKFLTDRRAADSYALERFHREARAASALNHPNICTIYDIEDHEGEQFIAMEYVEGRTIADLIAGRPLEIETVAKVGIQTAEGLAAAHSKGIIHRDIKPGNIIVTASGLVKILDFGLAKLLQSDHQSLPADALTQTGAVSGTVPYMSPEQLRGRDVDLRSDVFAMAAVLYEMSTGRLPFAGETLPQVIDKILNSPPPPPRQFNPTMPEKLEEIILKCLEKDPEDRYQGAKEIAVDLRRMIAPSSVTRTTTVGRTTTRKRLAWVAAAAAIVVVAIVASWLMPHRALVPSASSAWEQVTDFPDSATSPAISPDGRMLTFLRGPSTFVGPGDVYLKLLTGGEPQRLTTDGDEKQDPVFSPDGSRIVYTAGGPPYELWSVPVTGGKPQMLMRNASALTWSGNGRVLFSEMRDGYHMAIVSTTESRSDPHDVYVPERVSGMAHRSYPSPGGKWVLVAEMETSIQGWLPCRLVSSDGTTPVRAVGPPSAPCTSAAWSPDGTSMYFSSAAGGNYHIWRQHFPDGRPEQVTAGPTQEEGIAMAPDGRSLITSVGGSQSTFWLHDENGERQIDTAAAVGDPRFSADGRKLFYVVRKQLRSLDQQIGELWELDVESGNRQRLLPGFAISEYDVSRDVKDVAVTVLDERGQSNLWIAALDRHSPPRRIEWPGPITTGRFDRRQPAEGDPRTRQ